MSLFFKGPNSTSSDEDVGTKNMPSSSSDEDVETSYFETSEICTDFKNLSPPSSKSREERLQMYMDSFNEEEVDMFGHDKLIDEDGCHPMTFKEFCSYQLDMMESDGFDIEDYSKVNDPGVMVRWHYPPEDPAPDEMLSELVLSSRLSIKQFNKAQNTHFGNVVVVKANVEPLCPYRYYITFEATDENNNSQTFQARVNVDFPTMKKEVELVRIKIPPKLFRITKP